MSQFTVLLKRSLLMGADASTLHALPQLCILELTQDNLAYLWPRECTISAPDSLDPDDPLDRQFLLTGEFLTYGGFYYSVSDYLRRNGLSEDLFYRFYLGELCDIVQAREALQCLRASL